MTIQGRDRLLDLYARELAYLREKGAAFADENRTIASRLSLSAQQSSDPHIERLLESFAFLTARIQQDIEDELPLITGSLLGALYPQLMSPIPAMAIATLTPDAAGIKATTGVIIEKGTPLFAEPKSGPTCRFRTAYRVTLWPLSVGSPRFDAADMFPPEQRGRATTALVLPLTVLPGGMPLEKLPVSRLRFYLGGNRLDAFALYDLLFANREVRAYVRGADRSLRAAWLEPAGFEGDDDVLPYPDNAHPGHRLLQEYFAFPDKFLFFDAVFSDPLPEGTAMEIVVLLEEPPPATLSLRSDTFRLGCTPVVNLFPKTTEPIRLDHLTPEYRHIPDVRRERTTEIHSIQRVLSTGQSDRGEARVYDPFFSYVHRADDEVRAFWHARRAPCARREVPGSDMWLSLVDLAFQPASLPVEAIYAETLCTNRDLAEEIDEETNLQFERGGVAATARCTTKPTQQVQPPAGGQALWRLVSNLTLGHVSLSAGPPHLGGAPAVIAGSGASGGEALRETLRSYIFAGDSAAERQILAIRDLRTRAVTRRIHREAWRGFCTGTEITLVLDETKLTGASLVLFTSVLSRFFAQYAHLNTFTELVLKTSDPAREWKPWPRMSGDVTLL